MIFDIVDVFAEHKYAGNQLAVVRLTPAERDTLTTEQMQAIALEFGYAETTFVLDDVPKDGSYDVRIFTVTREVPFAGHPTLGTAYLIHQEIAASDTITLNLKVGQIPVTFDAGADGVLWMQQKTPIFRERYTPEQIAPILSLSPDDIAPAHAGKPTPLQHVDNGLHFVIVPLTSRAALGRARVQREAFNALLGYDTIDTYLYCHDPLEPPHDLSARMLFSDGEDAATGSAAGCLTAYLVEYEVFGAAFDLQVEQGYAMRRPSILHLRGDRADGAIRVRVGGKVQHIARGALI
ncbi:MAG: PhzF family phenazine biosynthesis protein [Chloroflexota bacterium]|nr:PhzF family phenazine biosynthesis protein [Chloroflexota bacterium]